MSKTISLLTIIDSVDIANRGVNQNNTYIIDTEGYLGEAEGSNELTTKCQDGDILQWRVVGIRPNVTVNTSNYRGQAVTEHVINPQQVTVLDEHYWTSRVELGGNAPGTYQYTFDIVINNTHYSFDPFIQVSAA